MARTDPQVNFRIPADLADRLKEAAAANNRTLTAELVHRLESSFSEVATRTSLVDAILGNSSDAIMERTLQRISLDSLQEFDKAIHATLAEAAETRGAVSAEISRRAKRAAKAK